MPFTPIKTPLIAKKMFPNYVWNIPTKEKIIYLTFDDGPTPSITNWALDVLNQYSAKATFFCIGDNVEKHPDIFKNILDEGHTFGNHTQNHIKGWKTKTNDYLENIELCESSFNLQIKNSNLRKKVTNLFRPPYGQIKPSQGKKLITLDYKIIMWDVLSFDWDKNVSQSLCLNNVITKTTKGSIIVFHDSVKASKNMMYALPKVLEHFNKKGYAFKAL